MFKVAILQKRPINEQIDKNIETIIMAMEEASETMQIFFFYCRNVLLQDTICLCHMKKVLQMMIMRITKICEYAKKYKIGVVLHCIYKR